MDILDKIMSKLNKKEKAIIVELFTQLRDIKDENDELIDMFLTERFPQAKTKVCRKYKNKNPILDKEECCPLCNAPIANVGLSTKVIIQGMTQLV
jgi:DNA repair exonuclease SbcCD ATPase subunit